MNRNEEYQKLLQELETPNPAVEHTLTRAKARNRRRKCIFAPALSLTAVFACFVLMVNTSPTIAQACAQIPILEDLVELVWINKSLETAIEHDYVQKLDLTQSQNGITVTLDSVIVDQKQVNVLYQITMEDHENQAPEGLQITKANFYLENGEKAKASAIWSSYTDLSESELQTISLDFINETVPQTLLLELEVSKVIRQTDGSIAESSEYSRLAAFKFPLKFDSDFYTTEGKTIQTNQEFELDGQKFCLEALEIYPTYLQLNLESDLNNTCWLTGLEYYLENENGEIFDVTSNGISSWSDSTSSEILHFRTESPWFYESNQLKIVFTHAAWLEKNLEKIQLDLTTGEVSWLPDHVTGITVSKEKNDTIIDISVKASESQTGGKPFDTYDPEGNYFSTNYGAAITSENEGEDHYWLKLENYEYDTVQLAVRKTSEWNGELSFTVDLPQE